MRLAFLLSCLSAWPIVLTANAADPGADAPAVRLVLELSDGSRIVGTPSIDRFKIATQYANLDIPLPLLSTLAFSGTNQIAQAAFRNGDLLTGQLAAADIALKTVFGHVVIPVSQVRMIRVGGVGKVLPDGLVLHYTFDLDEGGRVTDMSDAHNDGKVIGASYTSQGKEGGAMSFDGDREGVIAGNPPSLQLQDFTIMAWIKRGSVTRATARDGMDAVLFGYGHNGYILGIHPNGHLFLSKVDINNVDSDCEVNNDAFHHVAVTKRGRRIVFYLDGVAYPAADYDPGFEFGTDAAVGARADTLDCAFFGVIDEVAVFNRELSGDEVKGIFDSQK